MTTYRLSPKACKPNSQLYVGRETGALYVRIPDHNRYICIVSAPGSATAGDSETGGGFDPVPCGTTITIEV